MKRERKIRVDQEGEQLKVEGVLVVQVFRTSLMETQKSEEVSQAPEKTLHTDGAVVEGTWHVGETWWRQGS